MNYDWGPWVDHDGNGCPVKGQWVICALEHEPGHISKTGPVRACAEGGESWDWTNWRKPIEGYLCARVLRYRVRRPRVTEWLAEATSDLAVGQDA